MSFVISLSALFLGGGLSSRHYSVSSYDNEVLRPSEPPGSAALSFGGHMHAVGNTKLLCGCWDPNSVLMLKHQALLILRHFFSSPQYIILRQNLERSFPRSNEGLTMFYRK